MSRPVRGSYRFLQYDDLLLLFKIARCRLHRIGCTELSFGIREIGLNEDFQHRTDTAGLTQNSYESTRLRHEAPG